MRKIPLKIKNMSCEVTFYDAEFQAILVRLRRRSVPGDTQGILDPLEI
jgi:hypothetical protein